MSKELTKMNLIAIVQQLPEEDIHVIETYIKMIELENKNLKEELSKYLVKPNKKEFIYNIKDLQQENKQLKHIMDELEKWLKETKLKEFEKAYGKRYGKVYTQAEIIVFNMILNKLQELKGSDKECMKH